MLMFPWYAIHHKINFAEKPSPASDSAWINSLKYNEQMRGGELYCCYASGRVWVLPAHLQPDGKIKMGKEPKAWPKAHNLGTSSAALPRFKPPSKRFLKASSAANAWWSRVRCTLYPTTSRFDSTMWPAAPVDAR